jgi:RNA polymerase sigma factor (sigma-70 family)
MGEGREDFAALMRRVREGSPEAAARLVQVYGPHILRVVRRSLHGKLRSHFDSVDVQQDVWASFFAGQLEKKSFDCPEALAAYLAKMTRNKILMAIRRRCATEKCNVNRERSLDGSGAREAARLASREPTPSQQAIAGENWNQLLKGQPLRYQRVLIMLRQGYTQRQIADELGVDERTVRRVLRKLAPEAVP